MKTFIVLFALVAAIYADSEAEAAPWWYGHGYGYYGYPYGYALGKPCVNNAGVAVPCALGHPLVNTQARRKREADPDVVHTFTGFPIGHHLLHGAVKSVEHIPGKVEVKAVAPVVAPYYHAPYAHYLGKREAEADAKPYWYGHGYGYYGYPYGYALGRPCLNGAGFPVPCAEGNPLVNSPAVTRRKREADPDVVHTFTGFPIGHYLLHGAVKSVEHIPGKVEVKAVAPVVAPYVHAPYVHYLGKREAEADAKPFYYGLHYPYAYHYPVVQYGAKVVKTPCKNHLGEAVDCALGPVDAATHTIEPTATLVYGRKKREADPVYFDNIKAEVTEHEAKYTVPVATYAATYPFGWPVATYSTKEVPYKYNTVAYKSAPVENPSDPTNPTLIHTSKLGICLNYLGLSVPC